MVQLVTRTLITLHASWAERRAKYKDNRGAFVPTTIIPKLKNSLKND